MRVLAPLCALLVACTASAPAEEAVPSSRASPPVEVAQAAPEPTEDCGETRVLAAIDAAPVQPPPIWNEVLVECGAAHDHHAGLTDPQKHTITVWPNGLTDDELLVTLVHEYGHALDFTYMTSRERSLWTYARGLSGVWTKPQGPNEDFAESFAYCLAGGDSWLFEELEAEPPGRAECALVLALLSKADMPGPRALAELDPDGL